MGGQMENLKDMLVNMQQGSKRALPSCGFAESEL